MTTPNSSSKEKKGRWTLILLFCLGIILGSVIGCSSGSSSNPSNSSPLSDWDTMEWDRGEWA